MARVTPSQYSSGVRGRLFRSSSDKASDGGESGAMEDSVTGDSDLARAGSIGDGEFRHEGSDRGLSGGDVGSALVDLALACHLFLIEI